MSDTELLNCPMRDIEEVDCCTDCQSQISMGEDEGFVSGPHDAVKAVQKLIIDGEEYRKKIRELKQLFVDMTFCANHPDQTIIMLDELIRDFKEIVGDDPEFTNTESVS